MQPAKPILVKLTDIADIVRGDNKTSYQAGTCYFYLSATDRQVHYCAQNEVLSDRCAIILPKEKCNLTYLLIVLEEFTPEFMHKYVGQAINLSFQQLEKFELNYHSDYAVQEWVVEQLRPVREAMEHEKRMIEQVRQFKKYMLSKMFI